MRPCRRSVRIASGHHRLPADQRVSRGLPVDSHASDARGRESRLSRSLRRPIGMRRPALARKDMSKLGRCLRESSDHSQPVAPGVWRLERSGVRLQDSAAWHSLNKRLLAPRSALPWRDQGAASPALGVPAPAVRAVHGDPVRPRDRPSNGRLRLTPGDERRALGGVGV